MVDSPDEASQLALITTLGEDGEGYVKVLRGVNGPDVKTVHHSVEVCPGVIVDYDAHESIVGVEFLTSDVSTLMPVLDSAESTGLLRWCRDAFIEAVRARA